ncbi:MAG: hypothetical protein RO469_11215 [Thermincola sp.]|jgi:hypothetical protein|nr:hypothetical protein [Thermincola sp.]MDT3701440.1 hypothetical protein [Thermincola sp.]
MGILNNWSSKVLFAALVGLFILFFWPGAIPGIIGNPHGVYKPLFWGWVPGWLVFETTVYLLIWLVSTVFVLNRFKD